MHTLKKTERRSAIRLSPQRNYPDIHVVAAIAGNVDYVTSASNLQR
jgi:hypothetical protein